MQFFTFITFNLKSKWQNYINFKIKCQNENIGKISLALVSSQKKKKKKKKKMKIVSRSFFITRKSL